MDAFMNPAALPQQVNLFTVWMLGMSLGLTACTATCLPFMGTWVLGRGGMQSRVLIDTALFAGGRVIAYSMLGALAAGAGAWLSQTMRGGTGNLVIGGASMVAGIWLLHSDQSHMPCASARDASGVPPLLLGFSLSLTPCVPLASLLAVCAAAGDIRAGAANGAAFGLGAAVTPLLVLLPLINLLGTKLRENRAWIVRWIRYGGVSVLVLLGLRRIVLVL